MKTLVPGFAGAVQFWFGSPNPGWASVRNAHKAGNSFGAMQSAVAGVSGVRLAGGGQAQTKIDVFGTLNPVDMRNAPVPKVMLWARLALEGLQAGEKFISGLFKDIMG